MQIAKKRARRLIFLGLPAGIALATVLGGCGDSEERKRDERVAAVAVAPVERQTISLQRIFNGDLEAKAKMFVAPKVSGRLESLTVDLGDVVSRGQQVAHLDDAEFLQAVKQAEAELAVAKANLTEARNALDISRRETQRIVTLLDRGISSEAEYDAAQIEFLAKEAQVAVAEAQLSRAEAALETARIRLGYTKINADWAEGDASRVVAERYVEAGETVSANEHLLLIVELDPISAVIQVTERDYGMLRVGQKAQITTDAFPNEIFVGEIERIAPVFRENTRQARIELTLPNPGGRLKPGMFIRARIELDSVESAVVVPESAITSRADQVGVFLVDAAGERAIWRPVQTGIKSGGLVQLLESGLSGRVVTLGQHLIDDGSAITIPEMPSPALTR